MHCYSDSVRAQTLIPICQLDSSQWDGMDGLPRSIHQNPTVALAGWRATPRVDDPRPLPGPFAPVGHWPRLGLSPSRGGPQTCDDGPPPFGPRPRQPVLTDAAPKRSACFAPARNARPAVAQSPHRPIPFPLPYPHFGRSWQETDAWHAIN